MQRAWSVPLELAFKATTPGWQTKGQAMSQTKTFAQTNGTHLMNWNT